MSNYSEMIRLGLGHLLHKNENGPVWTDDEGNLIKGPDMGDRFYQQQLKSTGKAPGVKGQKPDRVLKADIVASLPEISGLDKLTQKDLAKLPAIFSNKYEITLPTGRLKKPYLDELALVSEEIDWNKLTVATMTELIKCLQKSL